MDAHRDAVKDGISGVINVVSCGYHEGTAGLADVFDDHGTVKESFLESRRAVEMEALIDAHQSQSAPSALPNI
jgi:hypothetical protein